MLSPQKTGNRVIKPQRNIDAFTLIELLVVLGVILILSVVLVPALAATKPNSKVAQCLNSKRQLTLAWQMYAADNSDLILSCSTWIPNTSIMSWTSSAANTNTDYLTNPTNALIARYVKSAAIFKCPADYYQSPIGPRVRSVSLNMALGGGASVQGSAPNGGSYFGGVGSVVGTCRKMSDLAKPGPAAVVAFLDEHADGINDGIFAFRIGLAVGQEQWQDLPASYHNGAVGISFTDGHSEIHKWLDSRTSQYPVTGVSGVTPWNGVILNRSADYEWLNAGMPYR